MAKLNTWLFIESEDESVDSMSRLIGVECNSSWKKGDPRGRTGKVYKTNAWKLGSTVEVSENPDEVISQLKRSLTDILDRIEGHEAEFCSLAMRGTSGMLVGITAESPPAIILDAATLKRLSSLRINLEIDLVLT